MAKQKQPCQTVLPWLRENLGKHCTAPLTSVDSKALFAAVQIVELYAYNSSQGVADAFGLVGRRMQTSTQELAYHSIAHVMDWSTRSVLWVQAGMAEITPVRKCAFEPEAYVV